MGIRSLLYKLARGLGDVNATKSPSKIVNRGRNKVIGRLVGKRIFRKGKGLF